MNKNIHSQTRSTLTHWQDYISNGLIFYSPGLYCFLQRLSNLLITIQKCSTVYNFWRDIFVFSDEKWFSKKLLCYVRLLLCIIFRFVTWAGLLTLPNWCIIKRDSITSQSRHLDMASDGSQSVLWKPEPGPGKETIVNGIWPAVLSSFSLL